MRKLNFIMAGIAVLLAAACNNGKNYTVKGTVTGESDKLVNGTAYMFNRDRENPVRDTADVINGKFVFKGSVSTPEPYIITIEGIPGMLSVFLENDEFVITGTDTAFAQSSVVGGAAQTMMNRYAEGEKAIAQKYSIEDFYKEMSSPETSEQRRQELMDTYQTYSNELEDLKNSLIAEDPISDFALFFLDQEYYYLDVDTLSQLVNAYKADPAFAANKYVADLEEYLQKETSLSVGSKAPDFTLNDTKGNPITLSDIYKDNKVTMVDFWASWCGPCRQFNPTLVKIYDKYHKLGFGIVGVSLDRDRDAWLEGIKEDKLVWPQVSDLKYWQSDVAKLYNVTYIPQNTFVDSEGNIIGRKVSEEDIEALLDQYLAK